MQPTSIDLAAQVRPDGLMRLSGDVREPVRLGMAELRALPQREVVVTFECRTSGPRRHRFTGPLLLDVVREARPLFDPFERKDRLRFLVSVLGRDGHHAVLSWGEIDPEFGNTEALVAVRLDGDDLDRQGPHLVVPGDRCGGRHISRIAEIRVCADNPLW
ncbi:molybdopterin-dependent oxidoreductase [Nonomuraea sp. NPDC000554]|uniref:molybdopterin-dependent oxidoreductase n=1 Tax=Nonomuraea sp. NPDC000554 TaxID=3154259 RepID=UPI00331B7ECE